MKVFADLHHNDLFYSLQLLFEKRLNAEMYRPIGLEWWHEGYWNVYNHPATAGQYLGLDQSINLPRDVHGNVLEGRELLNLNYRFEDGIYYVKDPTKEKIQRAITLEKFKNIKFDIIISSIPQHIQPFNKLIQLYQPQAKHIFQVGNAWGHLLGIKNILSSTAPFYTPPDINICFYHQEFDLEMFKYEPPTNHNIVNSYIHYMQRKDLMNEYARQMPEFQFKSYGAGMEDVVHGSQNIANVIKNSTFTWHYKPEGDGYGFNAHNTYACGRPMIVWKPFYNGKLASQLMIDNQTCIDISHGSIEYNIERIKYFSQPENHKQMCLNAYNRFKQIVNFDEEEIKIRQFLENLK